MSRFRSVSAGDARPFEAASLPDAEKERLCRDLLAEFGAQNVREGARGELIHSCVLPLGGHTNGDRNPSASLNYEKLTYNCLGCGNSGGLLWFIGICRGTTGDDARQWIGTTTGTGGNLQDLSALLQFFDSLYEQKTGHEAPMPQMSSRVLDPWMWVHPYLTEMRGIPEETILHFKVGWDPEANRIVIPHFWYDHLVGWQTRRLLNDGSPKYHNSTDFPKDRTLYNYNPQGERAIVVESPMSVLAKWHLTPEIEATFGAMVTDRQARLISIHREVILFFDNDVAGWNATERVAAILEPYSVVKVASNPWAEDPGGLDEVTYMQCIEEAVPYALWKRPTTIFAWEGRA